MVDHRAIKKTQTVCSLQPVCYQMCIPINLHTTTYTTNSTNATNYTAFSKTNDDRDSDN